MGRPRGSAGTKASSAKDIESKSKTIVKSRATREKAQKSYREDEASDFDEEPRASSPEVVPEDSDSDFGGEAESSGSEYGKKTKKGKAKASPKKASPRGRKPKGKATLSPKKRGRKPKAAASNGSKKKKAPPAASSGSEDEEEKVLLSSSEASDSEFGAESSGSEYGKTKKSKKLKKEKAPTRLQPRRSAAPVGKKRGRKPAASATPTNGNKKAKLALDDERSEEEEEEKSEEEKAKSEDEEKSEAEAEGSEEELVTKTKPKPKAEKPKPKEKEDKELKNRTDTDFKSIDFSSDKKTPSGEPSNFKIACWNIGGAKAWVAKKGLEYLKAESPDIMCLQETKCSEKTKPGELAEVEDYPHIYWAYSEAAGHNGVATLSKKKPESVTYGFPIAEDESSEDKELKEMFNTEGRLIATEFEKFTLINVYVPNGGSGVKDEGHSKPYPNRVANGDRIAWDRFLRAYVKSLEEKKPVILTGDLNVAHEEIDLKNPKTNTSSAGFTKEEREGLSELLKESGVFDSFRALYPDTKEAYSFWTYKFNCRAKNVGWRLDYFLLSEKLRDSLCENLMRTDVYGSDHCPIVLFAKL